MNRVVLVTNHAVAQFRARYPQIEISTPLLRRDITAEVLAAIAEGRMATRMPRFALRNGTTWRGRRQRDHSIRFTWTADERRVYVIGRDRRTISVITVIRPQAADTGADVDAA